MKKTLIKSIFCLAMIGIAFLNINHNSNKSNGTQSLLSLNVEALAGCEIIAEINGNFYLHFYDDCHWICWDGGYFACPI